MMTKSVGIFTGTISDSPCHWCELRDNEGHNLGRFNSEHLDDLIYLLNKMKEAGLDMKTNTL